MAAITCKTTLAGLINSDQKHIDVGLTRTVLSGTCFNSLYKHQNWDTTLFGTEKPANPFRLICHYVFKNSTNVCVFWLGKYTIILQTFWKYADYAIVNITIIQKRQAIRLFISGIYSKLFQMIRNFGLFNLIYNHLGFSIIYQNTEKNLAPFMCRMVFGSYTESKL